jgi:predicted permease
MASHGNPGGGGLPSPGIESIWRDVRHAARQLLGSPGFTVTVVLTLALAVGANTAIFSVVNALLIQKRPYDQPERIATVYAGTTTMPPARRTIDGEQWQLLRDDVPSLVSAVSAFSASVANLQAGSYARQVREARVSARYLDVLGVTPAVGRNFSTEEDRPNGAKVAVVSDALWRTAFDANPRLLGRAVRLKGEPYTVIGVLPEHATTPLRADVYTPLRPSREGEGQSANYWSLVRLRDGATWQQAQAEMNRAFASSARTRRFPQESGGQAIHYRLVPLQAAQMQQLRPQVLVLMLAAGVILLIACANLAGLTLVRVLRRAGEMATRLALGASTWRIQRQLWIESLLLALVGGGIAAGVGALLLTALLKLLPPEFLPVADVPLDARVLAFTLGVSILTSLLFGALPAFAARKADLHSLMGNRSTAGRSSVRLRQGLIAGEVALTVVLLAAAGLLIRSLVYLQTLPPGFDTAGVTTVKASLDDVRYHDPAAFRTLLDETLDALRRIPGVEDAAVVSTPPYERPLISGVRLTEGPRAGQLVSTNWAYVTPTYFSTLKIPLVAGRAFTNTDGPDAQPVVIVNRTFARKFLGDLDPVGRSVDQFNGPSLRIVGVVGDTVLSSAGQLNDGSAPLVSEETIYVPAAQVVDSGFLSRIHTFFQPSWIVRAAPAAGLPDEMQRALDSADPGLAFSGLYSMQDLMGGTLALQRVEVALLSAMAALALALSAVGIAALVMQIVAQRTREIGIRLALGSSVSRAMMHVAGTGAMAAVAGGVTGLGLCVGILRAMRSVLYGVVVYDVPTLSGVALCLVAVTILATMVPAMRIARIDAARVLREE